MKQLFLLPILALVFISAKAQNANDKKQLENLCGCFEVSFKYAETFAPDRNYKFHDREDIAGVTELALPLEVSDKKVVIQHLLVVSPTQIVKHWREEWSYENPVIWEYTGDKTWTKKTLPASAVKGKWTQTVWEVSDEPRYQGFSQFVNMDGKTIWQSTADAPLPRREYSKREDYNLLRRTNRLNITDTGYVHEQDNRKIIRGNGAEQLLAEEKGLNIYVRRPETECAAAREYWEQTKTYWNMVRTVWNDYVSTHDKIQLKTKVEGKMLNEYLNELAKEYTEKKLSVTEAGTKIKTEIGKFTGK